ncbi:MAG TPA: class I SAM-dependent methyltransferase [Candidatus Paceibacterota bacterium]|nr:class I SAM-dependent methyltransferase [Candidatus Paceibacterota bacterium]
MKRTKVENTPEYRKFKIISDEDTVLLGYLSKHLLIGKSDEVLDIGGREGYISLALQNPNHVTIVENDPDVRPPQAIYLNQSIQDVQFDPETFDIIIFAHVLGVLERQEVLEEVINRAYSWLKKEGTMVLFYNTNSGYMGELLEFARKNLKKLKYDYFDEKILSTFKNATITEEKVVTPITYNSFEELGRACWYLFSACDDEDDSDDMNAVAALFIPKLKKDLSSPEIDIEQKIILVKKYM